MSMLSHDSVGRFILNKWQVIRQYFQTFFKIYHPFMKKSSVAEIPSLDTKRELVTCSVRTDLSDTLELWNEVSKFIKELVSGDAYHRWFESAKLVSINETEAVLACLLYTSPSPRDS